MMKKMFMEQKVEYFLLFIILILILSSYSNSLYAPVTLDDTHSFVEEPLILGFTFSWEGLYGLSKTRFGLSRFLPVLSFALDLQWGSGSVIAFHITNVIIHLLATLALFFLLKSFFNFISYDIRCLSEEWQPLASIVLISTVGLWALNPVQTNAVTYLVQRMTSMAALFYFFAMGCYFHGRKLHSQGIFNGKTITWYLLFCISAICSFMSKQISITLPVMVLLVEFLFVNHGSLKLFLKKYRFLLILVLLLSIPLVYYKFPGILERCGLRHFTIFERLLTELRVVSSYIFLLLLPLPKFLNLEHDPLISTSLFEPFTTLTSLLFLLLIVVYAWRVRKRYPVITFAVFWFFINLLLESSVIPLELKFEHRLYLPSVGFFLVLVLLLYKASSKFFSTIFDERNHKILFVAFILVLLSGLSLLTFKRNIVWQDSVSLYRDCVYKSPKKARVHGTLGRALCVQGKYEEAVTESEKALSLGVKGSEVYWTAACNLTSALFLMGEKQCAIERGEALLADPPLGAKKNAYPQFLHNLGNIYVMESKYQKACDTYMRGFKFASKNKNADRAWKPFLDCFSADLLSLFKICAEQKVYLDVDGLTPDSTEFSACEKMAEICYNMNELELAAQYCDKCADKNGSLLSGSSHIKEEIDKRNSLNYAQQQKGTIKTKYFYHPFSSKFNFYMAAAYGLLKAGLPDYFLIDYFLKSAEALQPDSVDVLLVKSWLFYRRLLFDNAISEVDKAINLDSEYAQLWINRGLYCIGIRRVEDALTAFLKAKELYPDNPKNAKLYSMIDAARQKLVK